MTTYRYEFNIIVEVINYIRNNDDAIPTRIMYACRLTHARTKEILNILLENALIDVEKNSRGQSVYTITLKGMEFRNHAVDALGMIS